MKEEELPKRQKLYKVTCLGMTDKHGIAYVVANDAESAYRKLRNYLDERDYGFDFQRRMDSVELIAEDYTYHDTKHRLIL